jgi:hypothetical protein
VHCPSLCTLSPCPSSRRMSGNNSRSWTPTYGSATYSSFTPTDTETPLSPSRYSYTPRSGLSRDACLSISDFLKILTEDDEFETTTRRYDDDSYTDDDSINEDTPTNLADEFTHPENTLTQWSQEQGFTPSSYTGSYTGTGTYTGSPSYVTLPTVRSHTPTADNHYRLSRITEHTEESRPTSHAFSSTARPANPTPDAFRRSTLLQSGTSSGHSRSTTDPGGDRTLPPAGRTAGLIAVFESQGTGHSRFPSAPGRTASPLPTTTLTTTGYGYSSTGYGSRPSSPSKSSGSSGSYTNTETRPTYSSLLSPPTRTGTSDYTRTGSYITPSTLTDTLTRTLTNTQTGTETVTGANSGTLTTSSYADTGSTFTPTSSATLRRPQAAPRSPLASVRNLVSAWKERTPVSRSTEDKPSDTNSSSPPMDNDGLRRRVGRLRESGGLRPPSDPTPPRRESNGSGNGNSDNSRISSTFSGALPPISSRCILDCCGI